MLNELINAGHGDADGRKRQPRRDDGAIEDVDWISRCMNRQGPCYKAMKDIVDYAVDTFNIQGGNHDLMKKAMSFRKKYVDCIFDGDDANPEDVDG